MQKHGTRHGSWVQTADHGQNLKRVVRHVERLTPFEQDATAASSPRNAAHRVFFKTPPQGFAVVDGSRTAIFPALPCVTQTDAVMLSVNLELNLPPFVTPGENVAAYNANGCAGDHVAGMMLAGLDTTVSNKGRGRVSGGAILPAVTLAHKLCGRERNRTMPRRKGMSAAVGPPFVDSILQAIGDTERECRGLAKLQRALAVLVAERQSCRSRRQEILENVARKLDAITRSYADAAGETKENAHEQRRCV